MQKSWSSDRIGRRRHATKTSRSDPLARPRVSFSAPVRVRGCWPCERVTPIRHGTGVLLTAISLLFAAAAFGQGKISTVPGKMDAKEAEAKLHSPVRMDAEARVILSKSAAAYGKLKTLETVTKAKGASSIARLKRPNLYHFMQKDQRGTVTAIAVSDGKHYREFMAPSDHYSEHEASWLERVPLAPNIRPFFVGMRVGDTMVGTDGKPSVREYSYSYAGEGTINGKPTKKVSVSTLVRTQDGSWRSFDSIREFDAKSNLIVAISNGPRQMTVSNKVNPPLPTAAFRWPKLKGVKRR